MNNNSNPLMGKIKLPGRTFQLPSRAALYHNSEVNNAEGEIHVHPLSALSEISLKSPDLLFNGKALEAVFAECIPDIGKASELYGRDVDAIMHFLRLVTYGPAFEINVKHTCTGAKNHSYSIDIEQSVQNMKQLDPSTIEKDFTCVLPNGQIVKVHPVKFSHMIKLYQMNLNKSEFTDEDTKKNLIFNLVNVISSVDDVTNKAFIEEWVRALSTPYQKRITEVIERTNDWGPSSTSKIVCRDCGEEFEVELPLNPINFFTE